MNHGNGVNPNYLGFHTLSVTQNFQHELCHTLSFNTNFHPPLRHTLFHTQLYHAPCFNTNLQQDTTLSLFLSHTPLSRAIFQDKLSHTQLCHTLSFTHNFVTHQLSTQTTLFLCGRRGASGTGLWRFAWQAWGLVTSTLHLRGSRGHIWHWAGSGRGTIVMSRVWWRAWGPLIARATVTLCVACVALGDIDGPFAWQAWQAWYLAKSTFVWCGMRGTWVALVAGLVAVFVAKHKVKTRFDVDRQ